MHWLCCGALEDSCWNQDHDVRPSWLAPILLHTTRCGHCRHTRSSDVCRHQSQSIPCYHGCIQTILWCLSAHTSNGVNHPCATNGNWGNWHMSWPNTVRILIMDNRREAHIVIWQPLMESRVDWYTVLSIQHLSPYTHSKYKKFTTKDYEFQKGWHPEWHLIPRLKQSRKSVTKFLNNIVSSYWDLPRNKKVKNMYVWKYVQNVMLSNNSLDIQY